MMFDGNRRASRSTRSTTASTRTSRTRTGRSRSTSNRARSSLRGTPDVAKPDRGAPRRSGGGAALRRLHRARRNARHIQRRDRRSSLIDTGEGVDDLDFCWRPHLLETSGCSGRESSTVARVDAKGGLSRSLCSVKTPAARPNPAATDVGPLSPTTHTAGGGSRRRGAGEVGAAATGGLFAVGWRSG